MATIKTVQEWHEMDDLPDDDILVEVCLANGTFMMASTGGCGNWYTEHGHSITSPILDMFRYWAHPTSPLDQETGEAG